MELKDLVGKHMLSGVDITNKKIKADYGEYFEDCQSISFCLDGIVYTAIEDPDDGYRSSMKEIKKTEDVELKNTFEPQEVLGVYHSESVGNYDGACDLLELIDTKTGNPVLFVGTENIDDYYPGFVINFMPENMKINLKS